MSNRSFVQAQDVPTYYAANHTGTVNPHFIDPKFLGAKNIEIVCGTLQLGHGALPQARPGMEQVCYVLEGAAIAGIDGQRQSTWPRRLLLFSCRHAACLSRGWRDAMQSSRHLLATLRGRLRPRHSVMRWTD